MGEVNPYAVFVGKNQPLDVIAETPRRLAQLAEAIGPARMDQSPAPGKWSAREILCHLADNAVVCSLTHLRFPPNFPFLRNVTAYQKRRVKKLKRQEKERRDG